MIRIAIVDDEKQSRSKVLELTRAFLKKKKETAEVKEYAAPMELLLDLEQGAYFDLFLLDVEMPVLTGIETAREIRKYYMDSVIIYITDYVEYAVQAFEVNTFRYIPKKDLNTKLPEAYEAIFPSLLEKDVRCYIVRHYLDAEVIQYHDIYCLEKDGKYVIFHHRNGESRAENIKGGSFGT